MDFTIFDLEWNGAFSMEQNGYFNEIIQFGAVRTDEHFQKKEQLNIFVQPKVTQRLSAIVEKLTNISEEDLQNGMDFKNAFRRFSEFSKGSVLMTWGNCDIRVLVENYTFYEKEQPFPLGGGYADIQAYCQNCLGQPSSQQLGLSTAAELLGLSTESVALHRAIDDSLLSLECFQKLYDAEKLKGYLQERDQKFYDRLLFKNTFLVDINNPLIDRKKMVFSCPECGKRLHRDSEWLSHNKQFTAGFTCESCQKKYRGRYQFRLRYEGVQVKKGLSPVLSPEEIAARAGNQQTKNEGTEA